MTTKEMNDGTTPETDLHYRDFDPAATPLTTWVDFARKLEHERDQARAELAELRKDRERLDYCDTVIDLEPDSYVLRFPVAQSCTIRQAVDAARSQP